MVHSLASPKETVIANKYTPVYRVSLVREASIEGRPEITSTGQACDFVINFFKDRTDAREIFCVAYLNTKNKVIGAEIVTQGTLDASLVHPREVFLGAILANSSAILIFHNHPSGELTPSSDDINITQVMTQAGELLGIKVLDHIVYGDGTKLAISLKEHK